jgi:hypothetical protein
MNYQIQGLSIHAGVHGTDNHTAGLGRFFYMRTRSSFFHELTWPRNHRATS